MKEALDHIWNMPAADLETAIVKTFTVVLIGMWVIALLVGFAAYRYLKNNKTE